ncbi:protein phosphatase 2C [Ceratobasidium sp. AG-Ba]|nr:protein phosphatase 2C [Ceratobasidium sp. AG-Ba]
MTAPHFQSYTKDGRKYTTLGAPAGYGPWLFQHLHDPELTQRLHIMSNAKTSTINGLRVDSVSFQPCPSEEETSQDRVYSGVCDVDGDATPWSLVAVFDGHAGHDCADHAVEKFPEHLRRVLSKRQNWSYLATAITQAFKSFDEAITRGVLSVFPSAEALRDIPQDDLKAMINDYNSGGEVYKKIILAMRGTTALTALVDGPRKNLWVAGIGDCRAILGVKLSNGQWEARDLIPPHNGTNPREMQNVRDAHPGEPNVTARDRVLGAIAVTRAFGDTTFKLPAEYTHHVFLNANPGFRVHSSVTDVAAINHTPPYLSATPDIQHITLTSEYSSTPRFLIMGSDGLVDESVVNRGYEAAWFQQLVEHIGAQLDAGKEKDGNLALVALRQLLGGENTERVSAYMTLEAMHRWMDDTSIQVVVF